MARFLLVAALCASAMVARAVPVENGTDVSTLKPTAHQDPSLSWLFNTTALPQETSAADFSTQQPELTAAPVAETTPAPFTPASVVETTPASVAETTSAPASETTPATVAETTPTPVAEKTPEKQEGDHSADGEHKNGTQNHTLEHHNRAAGAPASAKNALRICTWNIFRFGPKKFDEPDPFLEKYGKKRIDMITEQICNAEILAMQEFFDPTLAVLEQLVESLNAKCGKWGYAVSDRVGRTSKEQYVFLYKKDVAEVVDSMTYPEPSDIFSREPFFAHFKVLKPGFSMKEITLGTIHTEPKKAVQEMNGLVDTYDWAEQEFGTKNVMVLGDYNADCQYVRKSAWSTVNLFTNPDFKWFIPTGVDTASMNSECTFDRAVVKNDAFKKSFVENSLSVLDFVTQYKLEVAQARQLSDHFPVCMQFK